MVTDDEKAFGGRKVSPDALPNKRFLSRLRQKMLGFTFRERQIRLAYLLISPTMLYVAIIFLYPLIYTVYLTFHKWNVVSTPKFVGFDNIRIMLADDVFWQSLKNTVYFTSISVPVVIILSLAVALGLQSSNNLPLRNIFKTIFFLPVTTSIVAAAVIWVLLFLPKYGIVNEVFLRMFNLPGPMWLNSAKTVIPSLAIIYIWMRMGFDMIILIAGLEGIPRDYYDAGRIDGATGIDILRHITVPLLMPQLLLVLLVEVIFALQLFALPFAATFGGPANASRSIVMHIFFKAFHFYKFGEASAIAMFLFILILILTLFQRRLMTRTIQY